MTPTEFEGVEVPTWGHGGTTEADSTCSSTLGTVSDQHPSPTPRVAALLAAGAGSRYIAAGGEVSHKLLALVDGVPVWRRALAAVVAGPFDHIVVVTGAIELELPLGTPPHVGVRHNPNWATGQASSLQVAVAGARALGASHVCVGLADQPGVPTDAWRAVAEAPLDHRVVVTRYRGVIGPNPVRLHHDVWPLLPLDGDEGARPLFRAHPDWVWPVDCDAPCDVATDIDTPEDLQRWNNC